MDATGLGTDYKFDSGDGNVAGTLKFSSDGSKVTVRFTKNTVVPDVVIKSLYVIKNNNHIFH